MDTHSLVEPLLAADKGLRTALAVNQIFVTDADGNVVKNKYNGVNIRTNTRANSHCIKRMVESQMKKAVATASFWYTAWVNAGNQI
jgi:hypothetical protein